MLIAAAIVAVLALVYAFIFGACRSASSADDQSEKMFAEYTKNNSEKTAQLTLF